LRVPNIPTAITIVRLLLAPVIAYLIVGGDYAGASAVFVVAALSDLVDGAIARRFSLVSEFGARLDAIADKVLMLATAVALAWQGLLPFWLAAAIVLRDVVVLSGAIAYRVAVGHVEMAPSILSKLNTAFEFTVIAAVIVDAAGGVLDLAAWRPALFGAVFLTIVLSGGHYVWAWARKAASARRAGGG
jgi:cardiolipin synthase